MRGGGGSPRVRAKFKAGLFDNPYVDETRTMPLARAEARRVAQKSIVLLKNDGLRRLEHRQVDVGARCGLAGKVPRLAHDRHDHLGLVLGNDVRARGPQPFDHADRLLRLPDRRPRPEHVFLRLRELAHNRDLPRLRQRQQRAGGDRTDEHDRADDPGEKSEAAFQASALCSRP